MRVLDIMRMRTLGGDFGETSFPSGWLGETLSQVKACCLLFDRMLDDGIYYYEKKKGIVSVLYYSTI